MMKDNYQYTFLLTNGKKKWNSADKDMEVFIVYLAFLNMLCLE